MKFTDKTLAEEEWKKIYGNWPSDSDFAWPFFRDAFNAGNNTINAPSKKSNKPFYQILRSKFLFSTEISDDIILELTTWLSDTYKSNETICVSEICKKLKEK